MNELIKFENTSINLQDSEVYANRDQLMELYNVPAMTLSDNIKKLKEDGLIVSTEIRSNLNNRKIEMYNLDEIIAIGLRLRSDKAILFQRWAIFEIKKSLIETTKQLRMQQAQLDFFWDKSDQKDLYK
jgi:hypothetical protein